MQPILRDLPLTAGDEVAVLVNGLGATGLLELYIVHRRVAAILDAIGVKIHHSWVGEYATSLEMAGASVTLLKLDADLKALLDTPCRTSALTVGAAPATATGSRTARAVAAGEARAAIDPSSLKTEGPVTPAIFRRMMLGAGAAIAANRDWLSELDGVIGDGDHGVTMDIGWSAVCAVLAEAPEDETISETSERMAKAFLDAVGASSGPLYATAFRQAGLAVKDRLNLDAGAMVAWMAGVCAGIQSRGGAKVGDKTMVDVWVPAVAKADEARANGADVAGCLDAACAGAKLGRDQTADIESRRGRSKKLGARSIGHIDPGAASALVMLVAMRNVAYEAL
jgi:dihydroxyacetone kinase